MSLYILSFVRFLAHFQLLVSRVSFYKWRFGCNIMVSSGVGLVIKQFFSTDAENPFKVPLTYFLIACLVMSGIQLCHVLMAPRTVVVNRPKLS